MPKGGAQTQTDYFQQEVHHRIEVRLDDSLHQLEGHQQITYINHSPDTLREIYMHLWPNAYSTVRSAFAKQQLRLGKDEFFFAPPEERGGYRRIGFTAEGDSLRWQYVAPHPDIALVRLPHPLAPGDSIVIGSEWLLQLPRIFSRLGHEGQSYMITQWYPKPAVYDREGWHPMPYLEFGEFYSEFGDFDVRISLPRNYVVAATGTLQTPEERRFLLERMEKTLEKIRLELPPSDEVPPSDTAWKTIRFTASGVHDFAWFADKRFNVRMQEVVLPSGKEVVAAAYFLDSGLELWKK
ncbi:MAG: M1 family peptidase, partial [Bacteroidetes bacterium]